MQRQSTYSNDLQQPLGTLKSKAGPGRSDLEAFDLQPFRVPVRASCRYQKLDCQSQPGRLYLPKVGQRYPVLKLTRITWRSGTFSHLSYFRVFWAFSGMQTTSNYCLNNTRTSLFIYNRPRSDLHIIILLSMFRHVQAVISVGKHPQNNRACCPKPFKSLPLS